MVKILLVILIISILIFLGKINFPAPNKLIKQEIQEKIKIVK